MTGKLCCPDCGSDLEFIALTNGTHVCECPNENCRNVFACQGPTPDAAATKLVKKCEQYGYTRSLDEKIKALAGGEVLPARPAG